MQTPIITCNSKLQLIAKKKNSSNSRITIIVDRLIAERVRRDLRLVANNNRGQPNRCFQPCHQLLTMILKRVRSLKT